MFLLSLVLVTDPSHPPSFTTVPRRSPPFVTVHHHFPQFPTISYPKCNQIHHSSLKVRFLVLLPSINMIMLIVVCIYMSFIDRILNNLFFLLGLLFVLIYYIWSLLLNLKKLRRNIYKSCLGRQHTRCLIKCLNEIL